MPERRGGSSQSGVIKVIRANPLENLKNAALVGLGALDCDVDTCTVCPVLRDGVCGTDLLGVRGVEQS